MKIKSFQPTFASFSRQRSMRVLLLSLVLDNVFLQHEAAAAATASRYHSDFSPSSQHVPEDDRVTEHAVESAGAGKQLSSPLRKYLQSFAGAKSRFPRPDESPAAARHATHTSERDLGQGFNSQRDSDKLSAVHGRSEVPRHHPVLSSGKYYNTHGRLREPDSSRTFHEEGKAANEPTHLHDDTRNAVSEHASKLGKKRQGEQYLAGGQTVERGAEHSSESWQGSENDRTQPLKGFGTDTDSQEFGNGYGSRDGLSRKFSSGHKPEGKHLPEFGSGYARGHDNMLTSGDENSQHGPAQQERGEQTGTSRHLQPSSDQRDYQSHKGDHEYVDGQSKLPVQNQDWADASSRASKDNSAPLRADTPGESAEEIAEENTAMDGKNAEATDTKPETMVASNRNKLTGPGQEYPLDGQPKLPVQNQDWADASSRTSEDNSAPLRADTPEDGAEAFAAENTAMDGKNAEATGAMTKSKSTGQETNERSSENGMEEPREVEDLASVQTKQGTDREGLMKIIRMLIKSEEAMKSLSNMLNIKQKNLDCSTTAEECVDKNQPAAASSVPEDSPGDRQQNLRIQDENAPDTAMSSVEDASNPIIVSPTVSGLADQRDVIGSDPVSRDANEAMLDDPVSQDANGETLDDPVSQDANEEKLNDPVSRDANEAMLDDSNEEKLNDPVTRDANEDKLNDPVSQDANEKMLDDPVSRDANEAMLDDPVSQDANEEKLNDPVTRDANEDKLNDPVSQDANEEKLDNPSMPTASVVEVDEEHLQKDFDASGQQNSEAHVDDEENPALDSDSSETLQTDNAQESHSSASVSTNVESDNKQEDIVADTTDMVTNVLKGLAVSPTTNLGPEDEVTPFFSPSHASLTESDVPSAVTDAAVAGKSFSTSYLVSPAGGYNRQYASLASNANGISDDDWMSAEPSLHAEREEAGKRSDVYYGQLTRFRRSSNARQQQETADVAHRFNQIAAAGADDDDDFYYDNDEAELSVVDVTNSVIEDRVEGPAQQLVTGRTAVFWPQHTSQAPDLSIMSLQEDSASFQIGKEDFLPQVEMPPANKNGLGISNNLQSNSRPTDISNAA